MIQYRNDTTSTSQSLCPHKLKFSCSTFQAIEQERKKRELFSDIIDIAKPKKTTKAETTLLPSPQKVQKIKKEPFEVPAKIKTESLLVDEEAQMEAMKRELKKGKREKKLKREKEEEQEEESPPPPAKKAKKEKAKSYLDDL